jgi:hypothetical protein
MELRLKIWRHTFPESQEVQIGLPDVYIDYFRKEPLLVVPIAMWIHSESRTETLKHYCIFNGFPQGSELIRKPLCFNPARDIICLSYSSLFPYNDFQHLRWTIKENLSALSEQHSSHMNKIRHLEIANVYDHEDFRTSELFSVDNIDSNEVHHRLETYSSALFHFPALRKIILDVMVINFGHRRLVDDTMKAFRAFVELHRDKFHGGKAPKVVAVSKPSDALKFVDGSLYLRMLKERVERLNAERYS